MPKPAVLLIAWATFLLPIGVVALKYADRIELPQPAAPSEVPGKVYFFSAPWCGACKHAQPAYQQLRDEGYPIIKINVDNDPDLAQKYGIRSIPTFVYVRDGNEVGRTNSASSVKSLFPWW